ncbi:hypothetical protein CVS40_8203 [Lucilia cuprina]|nr:hypothetical protein CVS40_8203 [Lucilia cuprina]
MEKLVGSENWSTWCFALKAQFELENLWCCIEGTCEDAVKETQARCRIILAIHKDLYVYVQEALTAKEIFEKLKNLFQDSGLDRRIGLLRKLCSIQMMECNSVAHYVSEVVSTAQKLNGIGFGVSDEWIASILLKGLPAEYNPMIMSMESSVGWKLLRKSQLTTHQQEPLQVIRRLMFKMKNQDYLRYGNVITISDDESVVRDTMVTVRSQISSPSLKPCLTWRAMD